ncbi:MAG: DUF4982 domain-containing protein [Proteobacteria bacterium]|nr:DUF4982 domain-containing protein [Pseudomonadota bacterium]
MNKLMQLQRILYVFGFFFMSEQAALAKAQRFTMRLVEPWRFVRGNPAGAASPDLDDTSWAEVRVPHDWAISGPMDPKGDSNSKFNWHGEGWYRYHLTPPEADAGKRYFLDFDGVMAFPKVYVNGQLAGEWDYGYNSFRVDATPYLNFGRDNVIAVHADTRNHASRWYPGAGIYRKVTLTVTGPVHVAEWGTFVTVPKLSPAAADVAIRTTIDNNLPEPTVVSLTTDIYAPGPRAAPVAQRTETVTVPASASATVTQVLSVGTPQLWDLQTPSLYTAVSVLKVGGKTRDIYDTKFGIRTLQFTKDQGLLLNGRRVQLHGANLHHDLGPLGAAFHRRAAQRQLEIMRDMGVNAVRFSHNPAAPEFLELADEMGFLVFAECFDKWDQTADRLPQVSLNDFAERQISSFVRRDRNHPSIMIWSIGNEIWDIEANVFGGSAEQVGTIASYVRANDPTRPVTMATHILQSIKTGLHRYLDVQSWNYGRKYIPGRQAYPDMPVLMSESASAVSSFIAGEFIWSGFDYIGEPTPYEKVARSSFFGAVDLVGLPKDRYYLYRSYWRPEVDTVHILPHWNWPNKMGQTVPVMVYTSGDSAELFLNGRSLGRQTKFPVNSALPANLAASHNFDRSYYGVTRSYRLRWDGVKFEPGELTAVAYRGSQKIGEARVLTAAPPTHLELVADRQEIRADGEDLSFITVTARDDHGTVDPDGSQMVQLQLAGPGQIVGVGNGDPNSLDPFVAKDVRLFHGQAVVIVRSIAGRAAQLKLEATTPRLREARSEIVTH